MGEEKTCHCRYAVRVLTRTRNLPGGRGDVRERSTTVAMHLIARVLRGEND